MLRYVRIKALRRPGTDGSISLPGEGAGRWAIGMVKETRARIHLRLSWPAA